MFRRILELIPRQPPGQLLDAGCGPGDLLALARDCGWEVTGVDPSMQSCAIARQEYGLQVLNAAFETADLPNNEFHVVTLLNVLDQAPDPMRVLKTARRVLRPEGLLVIRIINGGFHRISWALIRHLPGWMREALKPLVIFHPYCLNQKAIRALVSRAGLTKIKVTSAPLSGWATLFSDGDLRVMSLGFLLFGIQVLSWIVETVSAGRLLMSPSLLIMAERERVP
jgi:ubiquinone/menaquinone biosynthesis C-methylase UbiE